MERERERERNDGERERILLPSNLVLVRSVSGIELDSK